MATSAAFEAPVAASTSTTPTSVVVAELTDLVDVSVARAESATVTASASLPSKKRVEFDGQPSVVTSSDSPGDASDDSNQDVAVAPAGRAAKVRRIAIRGLVTSAVALPTLLGIPATRSAVTRTTLRPALWLARKTMRISLTTASKAAQLAALGPCGPLAVGAVKQTLLSIFRASRCRGARAACTSLLQDARGWFLTRRFILLYIALTVLEYRRRDRQRARIAAAMLLMRDITFSQAQEVMAQDENRMHLASGTNLRFEGQRETPNFLNKCLEVLWPSIESATQVILGELVEPLLDDLDLPPGVSYLGFDNFRLGEKAPEVDHISTQKHKDNIVLRLALHWDGEPDIRFSVRGPLIYAGMYPLSVRVRNLFFSGEARLTVRVPRPGDLDLGGIAFTFIRQPMVRYGVEIIAIPGQSFSLSNIPGLDGFLKGLLMQILEKHVVFPEMVVQAIPIPIDENDALDEETQKENNKVLEEKVVRSLEAKPCGTLRVTICQAKNLRRADLIGSSDPYCVLGLATSSTHPKAHKRFRAETKRVDNTLDPVWNEQFEFDVYDRSVQSLLVTVHDYDFTNALNKGTGDLLGEVEISITSLEPNVEVSQWFRLAGGIRRKPEKWSSVLEPVINEMVPAAKKAKGIAAKGNRSPKKAANNRHMTAAFGMYNVTANYGQIEIRLEWFPHGDINGISDRPSPSPEPNEASYVIESAGAMSSAGDGQSRERGSSIAINLQRLKSIETRLDHSSSKYTYISNASQCSSPVQKAPDADNDEVVHVKKTNFIDRVLELLYECTNNGDTNNIRATRSIEYLCNCGLPNRALPLYAVYPGEIDSANWLNSLLEFVWQIAAEFVSTKAHLVNKSGILKGPDESYYWMIGAALDKFCLGTLSPIVTGIKASSSSETELNLDVSANVASDLRLRFSLSPLGRRDCGISVSVGEVQYNGRVRLGLKPLVKQLPLVSALSVQLINKPSVIDAKVCIYPCMWRHSPLRHISIRPLDMPGIGQILRGTIVHLMSKELEYPKMLGVDILDVSDSKVERLLDQTHAMRGTVRIKILEVRNMPEKLVKKNDDQLKNVRHVVTLSKRIKGNLEDSMTVGKDSYLVRTNFGSKVPVMESVLSSQKNVYDALWMQVNETTDSETFCAGIQSLYCSIGIYADDVGAHNKYLAWVRKLRSKRADMILKHFHNYAITPDTRTGNTLLRMHDYINRNLPGWRMKMRKSQMEDQFGSSLVMRALSGHELPDESMTKSFTDSKPKGHLTILPFSSTILKMADVAKALWVRLHQKDTNKRQWPHGKSKKKVMTAQSFSTTVRQMRLSSLVEDFSEEATRVRAAIIVQTAWRGRQARIVASNRMSAMMNKVKRDKGKHRKASKALVHVKDMISAPEEQIVHETCVYQSDLVGMAIFNGHDHKVKKRIEDTSYGQMCEMWLPLGGAGPTTQVKVRIEHHKFKSSDNNSDAPEGSIERSGSIPAPTLASKLSLMTPPPPRPSPRPSDTSGFGSLVVEVLACENLNRKYSGPFGAKLRPYVQIKVGPRVRRTAASKGSNPRFLTGNREMFPDLDSKAADMRWLELSVWSPYSPSCMTSVLDQHIFLGSGRINLAEVVKLTQMTSKLRLEGVESGTISYKLYWFECIDRR